MKLAEDPFKEYEMRDILKVVAIPIELFHNLWASLSLYYSGVYYYQLTSTQKEALFNEMSEACFEVDLLEPETEAHKKCVSDGIKYRDQCIHEQQVAKAGAPVSKTYTTNATNVKQSTCVGTWC